MSIYSELPSSTYTRKNGKLYFVRKFGINGTTWEEELVPVPTNKVVKTLNEDGTEDIGKRVTVSLVAETEATK